ncbi:hypothetical protein C7A12_06965 [Pseudomonas fluorescens]|nr:hypothetical protein C7A12_06965 [Pseudomonas fluorescens]PRW82140.1 hypothetical protein C7A13_02645 [Pseudomonas fluorescens]
MWELIAPTLLVGTHPVTLCVTALKRDAERLGRHSHAERGNDQPHCGLHRGPDRVRRGRLARR